MKEYLKMSDVFKGVLFIDWDCDDVIVDELSLTVLESFSGADAAKFALHAISSHDELVSKLDIAESTIYEVERALSEMQRNGAFVLDDVISKVECCIKRLSQ